MKTNLLLLLCIATIYLGVAQAPNDNKRDYIWLSGYDTSYPYWGRNILSFADLNNPSSTYEAKGKDFHSTNASIADENGNLIIYTQGTRVFDRDFEQMPNGDSLGHFVVDGKSTLNMSDDIGGLGVVQGALILPFPDHPQQYYVFDAPLMYVGLPYVTCLIRLAYSVVDMNANNGKGDVILKNQIAIPDTIGAGCITACRHANGRDWWLIQRKIHSNIFYRVLLSPSGVSLLGSQTIGYTVEENLGQAVFSPDGNKFAIYGTYDDSLGQFLHIFDFDRCTGLLSNPLYENMHRPAITSAGCAISPNSRYLYISNPTEVFQYDLQAVDVIASSQKVAEWDGFTDPSPGFPFGTSFQWMQLAPDNKIYICAGSTRYLHTIDAPDMPDTACHINQHSVQLATISGHSLANFAYFRLGALDGSVCDTLGIDAWVTVDRQENSLDRFDIYPNPSAGIFTANIALHKKEDIEIAVLDMTGKILYQTHWVGITTMQGKIDLSYLAKGLYLLQVKTHEKIMSGKLMIE